MSTSELADLNRKLILDPTTGIQDPLLNILRAEDPDLATLHPLARAFALMEHSRDGCELTKGIVEKALETCWVSHYTEMNEYEPGDENYISQDSVRVEYVRHHVDLCRFDTMGTLYYADVEPEEVRSTLLAEIPLGVLQQDNLTTPSAVCALWNFNNKHRPSCAITDSGEFVGAMKHKLVGIGDLKIDGVVVINKADDIEAYNLPEQCFQPFLVWEYKDKGEVSDLDYDGCDNCFCWLHYLTVDQARLLGIRIDQNPDKQPVMIMGHPKYPDWVDAQWADDKGWTTDHKSWITTEDLEESYYDAEAQEYCKKITFFIAPGLDWNPPPPQQPSNLGCAFGDTETQWGDEEWEYWEASQPKPSAPPLFSWQVESEQAMLPEELVLIVTNIRRLAAMTPQG